MHASVEEDSETSAPRSDPKKLEKLEKVEAKSQGRSALSQGLIFLKLSVDKGFLFLSQGREAFGFSHGISRFSPIFSRSLEVFSGSTGQTQGTRFFNFRLKACFFTS